jgi:hypothetical protein
MLANGTTVPPPPSPSPPPEDPELEEIRIQLLKEITELLKEGSNDPPLAPTPRSSTSSMAWFKIQKLPRKRK